MARPVFCYIILAWAGLFVASQPFTDVVVSELSESFLGREHHTFFVDVRDKTSANPNFGQGSDLALTINGVEAETLNLNRGETYRFIFIGIDRAHAFIITSSQTGGLDSPLWTRGVYPKSYSASAFGQTLYWTVPLDAPDTLFYQDLFGELAGGKISISGSASSTTVDKVLPGIGVDIPSDTTAFFIDFEQKISHPWQGPDEPSTSSGNGYLVDGIQGKTLHLVRGRTYEFVVAAAGHPVFLSTSDIGGPGAVRSAKIVGDAASVSGQFAEYSDATGGVGILRFTPARDWPAVFYYQCALHPRMGGMIFIEDGIDFEVSENPIVDASTGDVFGARWTVNGVEQKPGAEGVVVRRGENTRWLVETPNIHPMLIAEIGSDVPSDAAWAWLDLEEEVAAEPAAVPDENGLHAWLNRTAWGFAVITLSPRDDTSSQLRFASAIQEYIKIADGSIGVVGAGECLQGTTTTTSANEGSSGGNSNCKVVETGTTDVRISFTSEPGSNLASLSCSSSK